MDSDVRVTALVEYERLVVAVDGWEVHEGGTFGQHRFLFTAGSFVGSQVFVVLGFVVYDEKLFAVLRDESFRMEALLVFPTTVLFLVLDTGFLEQRCGLFRNHKGT